MRVIAYSVRPDERASFARHSAALGIELTLISNPLSPENAAHAREHDAVLFIGNCQADAETLGILADNGIRYLSTRSTGINNIDLDAAQHLGLHIANVPGYSPHSVSEFTLTVTLAMLRRLHRVLRRTLSQNYGLKGLIGEELHTKTVGIIGTGKIGMTTAKLFSGLCDKLLGYDVYESPAAEGLLEYRPLEALIRESDIIILHCPLTSDNFHLMNAERLSWMKPSAYLVNTARGELVDTEALCRILERGAIAGYAGDVYEREGNIVHQDHTSDIIPDMRFVGLINMPNVLFTPHYAFYTDIAVDNMVERALQNVHDFLQGGHCACEVTQPATDPA